jgi:hypothetical protein
LRVEREARNTASQQATLQHLHTQVLRVEREAGNTQHLRVRVRLGLDELIAL